MLCIPIHRARRTLLPAVLLAALPAAAAAQRAYISTALTSDLDGLGNHQDVLLVNPWGIAFNPDGFVWVADNGTGMSTLYDGDGQPQDLQVTIPGGSPTGIVFNWTSDFELAPGMPALFIFATQNGIIAGWNPDVDLENAIVMAQTGGVYTGLTLAGDGTQHVLLATDFAGGKVDAFDTNMQPLHPAGGFVDPNLEAGYSPFNVQAVLGSVVVTYAQGEKGEEVTGPGLGIVDVFGADGTLVKRVAAHGELNAPWGVALAPSDFGTHRGELLIGNFGDGRILAFDPHSGEFAGVLRDAAGDPLVMDGLWGMAFGNGIQHQPTHSLFFAAGIGDEEHGVYGSISAGAPSGGH